MNLRHANAVTMIPVTDLDAAREFYGTVLDLELVEDTPYALVFRVGHQSTISAFKRAPVARGHTVVTFEVEDIQQVVSDLRSRGAVFEEYTTGPLATTDGIATFENMRAAWIKDPDGNVLGLREGPDPQGSIRDQLTV